MATVALMQITPDVERHIERCTRICYDSFHKMTENSHKTFLPNCIKRGHFAILSHAHATFYISGISRVCSHQLVRHAHLRYLQRSQRFCNEARTGYSVPPSFITQNIKGHNDTDQFNMAMGAAFSWYDEFTEHKHKMDDARYVLPNACHTEIVVSGTLQGWWDFLRLRLSKAAGWEIRDVAKQIYAILNYHCPHIFTQELLLVQPKLNLEFPEAI